MSAQEFRVETISKSEFAERLGVSRAAVTRALKAGRITTVLVDGKERIDPIAAERQWREYSRPYRRSGIAEATAQPATTTDANVDMTLHDARKKREIHEARIAELKERTMAGELVDRHRVRAVALRSGRLIRDTVLGVPTRVAHDLVVLDDVWALQEALAAALRQALDDAVNLVQADLDEALADGR